MIYLFCTLFWVIFPFLAQLCTAQGIPLVKDSVAWRANRLLTPKPQIILLAKSDVDLFHEGAVYHAPTKSLWAKSDSIPTGNDTTHYLQRVTGLGSPSSIKIERINHTIPAPIGGVNYISGTPLGDIILFAAQGTKDNSEPGGVYALNPYPPYNSSLLVGSYGDYPFNSPDDVTVTPDGTIYFTDPSYAYLEGATRPEPILPNQVYSYNPFTNDTRVVADGFGRPNGITTDVKGEKIYIGDTGANIGNGSVDLQGPRTIYVYDKCGPMLGNRRVFAMPSVLRSGPDGIKVDTMGNVWSGIAPGGVVVWDSEGYLLGSIELEGTIGDIGFGEPGELFVMGGTRLYKIVMSEAVIGV